MAATTTPRLTAETVKRVLSDDATYMGVCVVQSPGAWTRCGPTWLDPRIGWVTAGLGVRAWNTTEGLAELATSTAPSPSWHAPGVSVSPEPNLVLFVEAHVLTGKGMAPVVELTDGLGDAIPAA